ncbi:MULTISPECIES: hypothetical protein [Burkholderia]|uniref:hypothetical protein n=1 Tax=Burkholderia TaxID=32008 RepID=UPI000AA92C85|nr:MULTISPECIES: hypothetical protein [Burkholderia]
MNDVVVIDEAEELVDPEAEAARERAAAGAFAYLSRLLEDLPVSFYSGTLGIRSPLGDATLASNAVGVGESWYDETVREARLKREGVSVTLPNGNVERFKSVAVAFKQLLLPLRGHIRFRQKLKQNRVATFDHNGKAYAFELVSID